MTPILLAVQSSDLDVWSLVMGAGPMAKFVLFVLAAFSVISWGVIAERWHTFRTAERESEAFLEKFSAGGGLAAIQDATQTLRRSPIASIFRAGFREISLNPPPAGIATDAASLEALDRVLRKNASVQVTELERSLGLLATTAGATPFIGLFGTVWGIMNSFMGIGRVGAASLAVVAPGIAEALIATAAGLVAAIPAVVAYNYFLSRTRRNIAVMEDFSQELLEQYRRKHGEAETGPF